MELGSGSKPVNLGVHKVLKLVMADRDFCLIGSWITNANGQRCFQLQGVDRVDCSVIRDEDAELKVITVDQLL